MKRSNLRRVFLSAWCVTMSAGILARADDWPNWRGPAGDFTSKETGLPTSWGAKKNVLWKLDLPGPGGSTPAVWGDKLFLTAGDGRDLMLLCVTADGKLAWKQKLGAAVRTSIKGGEANEASASPSTDGKHVWAFVGSGDLACFTADGKEVWKHNVQKKHGDFDIQHGMHSTPLLHDGKLYLSLLHSGGHWLIAFDAASGKELWKAGRKSDAKGESKEAYTSPCLWRGGKEPAVVVLGADYATAHGLADGAELWRLGDLNPKKKYNFAFRIISSPVATPELLLVPTARNGPVVALKPGAAGKIDAGSAAEQWRTAKGSPDVPSPLLYDGQVYLCRENGVLICLDAKTGKQHYETRLHESRYRASPVAADGKIYCTARDGTFSVVKAGPKFELLASNTLPDEFTATPALSGGRIYLRGFRALYAVREGGK